MLRDLYRRWPFFSTVLSNMAQVLAKSDMGLAARYSELVDDEVLRRRVFDKIVAEHDRTIAMHKLITGHDDLLADNPALARSVFNRFPYLEPLNHLQVELLRRYRSGDDRRTGAAGHPADDERAGDGAAQQRDRTRTRRPRYTADLCRYRRRIRRPLGRHLVSAQQLVMAADIAASENGWAGQVCLPWPNAVTRTGEGSAFASARRWRFHRSGFQSSGPGAAEVFGTGQQRRRP